MNTKTIAASLMMLLALAFGGIQTAAFAADKEGTLNAADTKFIKQTGDAGMAEVKIATLGTQKAERADVKDLATMLVTDHTKANEELANLAKGKGVQLSAVLPPKAADAFKDMENESGKGFDKAFLDHMEKSHKDSIDRFEAAEKDSADGELKSWATKMLPTLRAHLDKIKELKGK